jgi:hypothetical protein
MLPAIRRRFTYANVAITITLLFAMSGGAYAAKRYIITSTKQISPSVLKTLRGAAGKPGTPGATGPAGPQGPGGPQGPAGEAGKNGTDGTNGTNGSNGTSVVATEEAAGPSSHCTAGGSKFVTGATTTYACNGGFTKTLPSGATERGVWSIIFHAPEAGYPQTSPISFVIPLATGVAVNYIGAEEGEGEPKENLPPGCSGTAHHPIAAKGHLCVFTTAAINAESFFGTFILNPETGSTTETGTSGMVVAVRSVEGGLVETIGTWALTAV